MHLIWRRYSRSGSAPPLFYWLVACGFAALAVWALVRGDWLVSVIAVAMVIATIAGSRLMRALAHAQRRGDDADG